MDLALMEADLLLSFGLMEEEADLLLGLGLC